MDIRTQNLPHWRRLDLLIVEVIVRELSDFLNLETKILSKDKKRGEIRISFNSTEELESFLERLGISNY